MPFHYKLDVINELKKAGFSTYRLRQEKIIAEGTLSRFRRGDTCSIEVLEILCKLLKLQPGDIIEYVDDE